jgi:hypothetical protein
LDHLGIAFGLDGKVKVSGLTEWCRRPEEEAKDLEACWLELVSAWWRIVERSVHEAAKVSYGQSGLNRWLRLRRVRHEGVVTR